MSREEPVIAAATAAPSAPVLQVLGRVDRFYDEVPRGLARAEDLGPLTLFVGEPKTGEESWRFYARPRIARDAVGAVGARRPVCAEDVLRVRARQRELGVPETFEWVDETAPGLRAAALAAGMRVAGHPLMVRDPALPLPPADPRVRLLSPRDSALAAALAVPHIGFAHPGTDRGPEGAGSLAQWLREHPDGPGAAGAAARIGFGTKAVALAETADGPVCSGQYNAVGELAEIVAVATLPEARRRGLALAVTTTLVAEAASRGIGLLFLAADSEAVARIYARAGFRRVGTCLAAEPATSGQ